MSLTIYVPDTDLWDYQNEIFIPVKGHKLVLEHSLISLSKWESKHHKMWLEIKNKTGEELLDYIRCMTINGDVPPLTYYALTDKHYQEILDYMENPMTASIVYDPPNKSHQEPVSSELIYYWMIKCGIPFECEKWHLNRLLMLIKICIRKEGTMSKADRKAIDARRAQINAERLKKMGYKG